MNKRLSLFLIILLTSQICITAKSKLVSGQIESYKKQEAEINKAIKYSEKEYKQVVAVVKDLENKKRKLQSSIDGISISGNYESLPDTTAQKRVVKDYTDLANALKKFGLNFLNKQEKTNKEFGELSASVENIISKFEQYRSIYQRKSDEINSNEKL